MITMDIVRDVYQTQVMTKVNTTINGLKSIILIIYGIEYGEWLFLLSPTLIKPVMFPSESQLPDL
jgi:hypothetical protein